MHNRATRHSDGPRTRCAVLPLAIVVRRVCVVASSSFLVVLTETVATCDAHKGLDATITFVASERDLGVGNGDVARGKLLGGDGWCAARPPCDRCGYARATLDLRLDTMSCRGFHALPCRCSQRQGVEEGVPIEKLLRRSASEYTTSKPNDVDDRTVISRRKRPRGSVYGPLVLLLCSLVRVGLVPVL